CDVREPVIRGIVRARTGRGRHPRDRWPRTGSHHDRCEQRHPVLHRAPGRLMRRSLLLLAGGGGGFTLPEPEREHGPLFEWATPLDDQWQTWDVTNGTYEIVDGQLVINGPNVGLYRPIPSIPFTVTAKIAAVDNDASSFSD